jgi:hypothetical protein
MRKPRQLDHGARLQVLQQDAAIAAAVAEPRYMLEVLRDSTSGGIMKPSVTAPQFS